MRLVVRPDLEVRVLAPRRAREQDVARAVQSKAAWIVKQLERMKELQPLPVLERRKLTDSDRTRALTLFVERHGTLKDIALHHAIPEARFRVRYMKTRWGSCSRAGKITLNAALLDVPVQCLDYVIMHELCHLVHHNHSRAFYALLTRCMPDWKERRALLNKIRLS